MVPTAEKISTATAPSNTAETNFPPNITTNHQLKDTIGKEKDQGHSTKRKIVKNIKTIKTNTMRLRGDNRLTTKGNLLSLNTRNTKRSQSMNKNLSRVTTMEVISTIQTLIIGLYSVIRVIYCHVYCHMKESSANFVEAITCKICVMIKIIAAKFMVFY
jgi:hypothetical protein